MIVRELITRLGFDVDDAKLKSFERSVNLAKNTALGLSAAVAGMAAGLFAVTKSAAAAGEEIAAGADLVGLTTEEFQKFRHAADLAEVSTEEFATGMRFLAKNIGSAVQGDKAMGKAFGSLGVRLKDANGKTRATGEVFRELSDRLAAIDDPAVRASVSMDIFGRSGAKMGRFLSGGTKQIDEASRVIEAFGFFTDESAKAGDAAGDSFLNVMTLIKGLKNELGMRLFPLMKGLSDRFVDWAIANKEVIKSKIDSFAKVVIKLMGLLLDVAMKLGRFLLNLARIFGGVENSLKLVALALASLFAAKMILGIGALIGALKTFSLTALLASASALALPLAIAAIIAMVALLAEDIYVFLQGGDSFIGWFDQWLRKMAEVSGIASYFNAVLEVIAGFWDIVIGLFTGNGSQIKAGFEMMFGDLVQAAKDGVMALVNLIPAPIRKAMGAVGDAIAGSPAAGGSAIPGMYGGFGFAGGVPAFSGPESAARPSAGGRSVNQSFNAQVSVQAMPGATPQDVASVRRAAEEGTRAALRREAQIMKQNHPEVD